MKTIGFKRTTHGFERRSALGDVARISADLSLTSDSDWLVLSVTSGIQVATAVDFAKVRGPAPFDRLRPPELLFRQIPPPLEFAGTSAQSLIGLQPWRVPNDPVAVAAAMTCLSSALTSEVGLFLSELLDRRTLATFLETPEAELQYRNNMPIAIARVLALADDPGPDLDDAVARLAALADGPYEEYGTQLKAWLGER